MSAATHNAQDWASVWASERPDFDAVIDWNTSRSWSYRMVHQHGEAIAAALAERGLGRGDRLALIGYNHGAYHSLLAAAQKSGIVLVPLNYRLATAELDYILRDADPKMLLYQTDFEALLPDAQPGLQYQPWSMIEQWTQEARPFFPHQIPAPEDPLFILYTSGTTGRPKGVLYTHKMLFWNSVNTFLRLDITSSDVTVNVMPPFHTGGWNVFTTPFFHHGAKVIQMQKFDASQVLTALEENQATLFMGVPTMLRMMADAPEFEEVSLRNLRYIVAGGESMPIPLIETWADKGVPIRQGYGMTEVGPNLTSLHQDEAYRKRGSIGTPNFYVQTRLVDDQGRDVGTHERGELLLNGPCVSPGYWRNEKATREAFTEDGWYRSGDVLVRDEEGFLFVVDRKKNLFITGGENVYPAEVERCLLEHFAVKEAVVVPYPHETWGEAGCAFVVLKPDKQTDNASLDKHAKAHLARFKVPKRFVFMQALPKNDSGKINRMALREMALTETTPTDKP